MRVASFGSLVLLLVAMVRLWERLLLNPYTHVIHALLSLSFSPPLILHSSISFLLLFFSFPY